MKTQDQIAHSVQSDLDLYGPLKSLWFPFRSLSIKLCLLLWDQKSSRLVKNDSFTTSFRLLTSKTLRNKVLENIVGNMATIIFSLFPECFQTFKYCFYMYYSIYQRMVRVTNDNSARRLPLFVSVFCTFLSFYVCLSLCLSAVRFPVRTFLYLRVCLILSI